jgi:hypothetical protein
MPFDKTGYAEVLDRPATAETGPKLWPIYMGLFVFLAAMTASVLTFGLPGLFIPAVAMVPVMFVILIRITLG